MKTLFSMAIISLMVFSCQQEELNMPAINQTNNEGIQLVEIVNGSQIVEVQAKTRTSTKESELALQFPSKAIYRAFLEKLKYKTHEERISYIQSLGLTSLQDIAEIADEELDAIWESTSDADFMNIYQDYKKKYEGILIANPYDSTDCSLYVPSGDEMATYVSNSRSNIVIGNEIVKLNLKQDLSPSDKLVFAPRDVLPNGDTNEFGFQEIKDDKYKSTVAITIQPSSRVDFHVGYQKRGAFWWKRDNRTTYMKIGGDNFYYSYKGPYGQPIHMKYPNLDMYVYTSRGKVDATVGGVDSGKTGINGHIQLWTDLMVEPKSIPYKHPIVNGTIEENTTHPELKDEKAYSRDFSLALIRN